MRGVRELACAEQKDEMRGMRHCAWDSEDTLPFIEGQFGNCQLTPNRYIKRLRTFNKMDHQSSKYQTHATFSKKLCFILTKHYFWADLFGLIFLKTQFLSFKSWNKRVLNSLGCERMQVLLLIDWVSLGLLVLSLRYMYLFLWLTDSTRTTVSFSFWINIFLGECIIDNFFFLQYVGSGIIR